MSIHFAAQTFVRALFRMTSFSPDHLSSTAHTLTSTNPSGSASARTTSSVISVATFAAFYGHDTHTIPSGVSRVLSSASSFDSSALEVTKTCALASPLAGD